ncbi:hypothetical protein D3C72_1318660 [compost metagenome]
MLAAQQLERAGEIAVDAGLGVIEVKVARVEGEQVGAATRVGVVTEKVRLGPHLVHGHHALPAVGKGMLDVGEHGGIALVQVVPVAGQRGRARNRVERAALLAGEARPVITGVAFLLVGKPEGGQG